MGKSYAESALLNEDGDNEDGNDDNGEDEDGDDLVKEDDDGYKYQVGAHGAEEQVQSERSFQ